MFAYKRRVPTSGGELAAVDVGEGPPVVLVHGFPLSSYQWRHYVPLLSRRMRVIAPDLLGYGDSAKPEGVPLGLEAQAGYVREMLRALEVDRFALVGAGLGTGIGQLLATGGAGVDAMVLMSGTVGTRWPAESIHEARRLDPSVRTPDMAQALLRTGMDLGMGHRARLTEDELAEFVRPFAGDGGAAAFFRALGAIDGLGLAGIEEGLSRLDIPVLILWGEEDTFNPVELAELLNEQMPSSTLGLLPGCGHFVSEDAPDTIGPMTMEWLRAHYLKLSHGHPEPGGPVLVTLERPRPDPGEYELDDEEDE